MDRIPTASQLQIAARACVLLAYTVGLGGVAAGTWLLREGDLAMAVVLWLVTFAVGACLMGISLLLRAVTGVTARLDQLRFEVERLAADRAYSAPPPGPPDRDPWRRH